MVQYRTGGNLGQGSIGIVKEAVHVDTGEQFACKVIRKERMQGREHLVSLEIA